MKIIKKIVTAFRRKATKGLCDKYTSQFRALELDWERPSFEAIQEITKSDLQEALACQPTCDALQVYVIGDSHVLGWDGLVIEESGILDSHLVFRSSYCPGFQACEFFSPESSRLHSGFFSSLVSNRLVVKGDDSEWVPFHFSATATARKEAQALQRARVDPYILISAGDIDIRTEFREFLRGLTFELSGGESWMRRGDEESDRALISEEAVHTKILGLIEPLVRGVKYLKWLGFCDVGILSLPPPTREDEKYFKINPELTLPLPLRHRLVYFFNHCLKRACELNSILFIDSWGSLIADDGYLRHNFEIDGVHLNRDGIVRSAVHVANYFASNSPARQHCYSSHDYAYKLALNESGNAIQKQFSGSHIVTIKIGGESLKALKNQLAYTSSTVNEMVRWDWMGNSRQAFSKYIKYSKPDLDLLRTVYEIVYSDPVHKEIVGCLGCDFVVYNVRPFQSEPHNFQGQGPQSFHLDGCPGGIIRGIIYLVDVDEQSGPFEYKDRNDKSIKVTAEEGTLLIFDANKLLHRGNPPRNKCRQVIDMVLAPKLPNAKREIMAASMNNWPVDPFNFSRKGLLSYSKDK